MEIYDVFKSDGGYRVCGAIWGDGPIISESPWRRTKKEAENVAYDMRFKKIAKSYGVFPGEVDDYIACMDYKFADFADEESAKKAVIDALKEKGYNEEYILKHRLDLRNNMKNEVENEESKANRL